LAGADQRAFGWDRPPWFDRVGEEHRAVRERAGLFDLSSFGKIDVTGPDAVRLLERAAANRVDVAPGRIVYTQFLDVRGGIVADVTVTRLGHERLRVTTGAAAVDGDLGWLRGIAFDEGIEHVELRDVSDELAVVAVWGRSALDVLDACVDVDAGSVAPMTGREVRLGAAGAWAQAVSFAGEPGWELVVRPEDAVQVWDRLVGAGRAWGLEPCGYRCLDGLRIEKGIRYVGSDLTAVDTPLEAGLERFVAFDGRDFIGRDALLRRHDDGVDRRLRTLLVGDGSAYLTLYGGEAVVDGDIVVGRVRSCAFGFTVERDVALAYLPTRYTVGDDIAVEIFGRSVPATVVEDVLVPAVDRSAA
jgi:glycine cleavage system T protein